MECAIFNKSWKQYLKKTQMYCYLPPISLATQLWWRKRAEKLLEKQRRTHKRRCIKYACSWTCLWQPNSNDLHQICAYSGCSLEKLPEAIDDRDGRRDRDTEFYAVSVLCVCVWIGYAYTVTKRCTHKIYTWMYKFIRVYTYIYIYIHTQIYRQTDTHTHTHIYIYIYIYIERERETHTHTRAHIIWGIYLYANMCVYIYIERERDVRIRVCGGVYIYEGEVFSCEQIYHNIHQILINVYLFIIVYFYIRQVSNLLIL